MTAIRRKIVRDVWKERSRSLAVVLAVSVGIASFMAVLSAYAILTRELNTGFLATNPPSATLHTDAVDEATVGAVRASGLVAGAEARRVLAGHIKTGPAEWRPLAVFVIRDFSHIDVGRFQPEQGAWPPRPGEMLIERNALQVARAKIGDSVTIKIGSQPELRVRVAGSVHDVGLAQARMENAVYGYIGATTLEQLGQEPYLDRLNIVVAGDRFDEGHIRTVARQVTAILESRGHPVRSVDVPPPGKHPHADIMGLLLLCMAAFGCGILALSGILVVNLLAGLMAAHVREIGVMKAVGAASWQIAAIYFSEVTILGLAAVVVALPGGIIGGRFLCRYMAGLLNFDMTSFAAPLWVYLLVLATGIGVPLGAAAFPIIKGSAISVREAVSDSGTGADSFGSTSFDRMLTLLRGPFRPLSMVLRNMFRRRRRSVLTVGTLAASGVVFISALNVRASLIRTLDRSIASNGADLWVTFDSMYPTDQLERAARGIDGIRRAEAWTVTNAFFAAQDSASASVSLGGRAPSEGRSDGRFPVIGLPARTNLIHMEMVAGRPLGPGDSDAIVVNSSLVTRRPTLRVGDSVALRTGSKVAQWRVIGVTREAFAPATAYVSQRRLTDLATASGMANSLRVALVRADPSALTTARMELDRNLERDGLRVTGSVTKAEARYGFDQHLLMVYVFLLTTSALIAIVGGLGLMTSTTLNIIERQREIGVLRAIGATTRMVLLSVIAESVLMGVAGWATATAIGWPVSKALGDGLTFAMFQTSLDFRFDPTGPVVWLALSISLSIVASLVPAIRISRVTIYQALAAA
jgi:putative ABC transport system permease protein